MAIIERIPHHDDDCAPGTRELNLALCLEQLAPGASVVDLGAGGGATARALRDAGMATTAVDLRPLPPADFEGIQCEVANLDEGIPAADDSFAKVEYTFGYKRNEDGKVRIYLHHSSLPYPGKKKPEAPKA